MKILHRLPTLWEVLQTHQDQSSGKPVYGVTKEFVASRSIPTKKSLPPGIRTLISAHRLSKLYSQVPHPRVFVAGTQPSPSPSITELGDEILNKLGLDITELLLIVAIKACLAYLGRSERGWSSTATENSVHMLAPSLSSAAEYGDDVFAWAVFMIGATTDKGSHAQRWAQRILEGMASSEGRGRELGERLVPIPVRVLSSSYPD